ncbi:hypothetical protein PENTCL1PPCAC_7020, partial [Pristionchus entomophagus]
RRLFLISCIILNLIDRSSSSSLDQTVTRLRHRYHQDRINNPPSASITDSEDTHRRAHALVNEWGQYEKTARGTGFHMERPDTGLGYGPGMGDIAVRTGLGVAYPFGGFNYRRDFELGMGGSGRIGGREVGWGNGMPGISASPWIG